MWWIKMCVYGVYLCDERSGWLVRRWCGVWGTNEDVTAWSKREMLWRAGFSVIPDDSRILSINGVPVLYIPDNFALSFPTFCCYFGFNMCFTCNWYSIPSPTSMHSLLVTWLHSHTHPDTDRDEMHSVSLTNHHHLTCHSPSCRLQMQKMQHKQYYRMQATLVHTFTAGWMCHLWAGS